MVVLYTFIVILNDKNYDNKSDIHLTNTHIPDLTYPRIPCTGYMILMVTDICVNILRDTI